MTPRPPGFLALSTGCTCPFILPSKRWMTAKQKQNEKLAHSPPQTHTPNSQMTFAVGPSRAVSVYSSHQCVSHPPRIDAGCCREPRLLTEKLRLAEAASWGGQRARKRRLCPTACVLLPRHLRELRAGSGQRTRQERTSPRIHEHVGDPPARGELQAGRQREGPGVSLPRPGVG